MTQPQAKIHHHIARYGRCATRPGQQDYQTMGLQSPSQLDPGRLQCAIAEVDEELAFLRMMQGFECTPEMLPAQRHIFRLMRRWPNV